MKDIRVVFMGTPMFAVPILEGLIEFYNVVGIVSQPDKEKDRKGNIVFSPVKQLGIHHSIKVIQPAKLKEEYQEILEMKPDIIITCAYGQLLPTVLLESPPYGCINVHASLLPELRGGAPIHHAIIRGYKETGVTVMDMVSKMDAGDIISQVKTNISEYDTVRTLYDRLSLMGRELLLDTLPSIIDKTASRITQDESKVTYGYNITKEEEHLDFNKTKQEVYDHIRGMNPIPGAYMMLDDKRIKVYASLIGSKTYPHKQNGEICMIYPDGLGIKCDDGEIIITQIKPEGKKEIQISDYLNGVNGNDLVGKILR